MLHLTLDSIVEIAFDTKLNTLLCNQAYTGKKNKITNSTTINNITTTTCTSNTKKGMKYLNLHEKFFHLVKF